MTGNSKPNFIIKANKTISLSLISDIFYYKDLLYLLIWRQISVRYKQTIMGILWVLLQPILMLTIFTIIFGRLAHLPSENFEYPIFALSGLLLWQFFARAISDGANSLVSDRQLLTKVYFPRLILPISYNFAALLDLIIALILVIPMLIIYKIQISWQIFLTPFWILLTLLLALGVSFWLSAMNALYRDIGFTIPFLIQFWMFSTPIFYSFSMIPEKWQWLFELNPMTGIIIGMRWSILNLSEIPNIGSIYKSFCLIIFTLITGVIYFKKVENIFADKI